jgi:haloalkane dehalogenase
MTIEELPTPEERFALRPNFPYNPHSVDSLARYEGLRLHYVDEGPEAAADTYLCLHGEPT